MRIQSLNEQERRQLDRRVVEAEKRTGAQIVLAAVERSDVYAELPWKAFALGAAVAGLAAALLGFPRTGWASSPSALAAVTATLFAGAAGAFLSIISPGFARLFLDRQRAEVEVRQYGEALFLSRELFATRRRTGVLLLVSLFERQIVVLPDTGLGEHLNRDALQKVISRMAAPLAAGQVARALEEGLAGIDEALPAAPISASAGNELPDGVIEEEGA